MIRRNIIKVLLFGATILPTHAQTIPPSEEPGRVLERFKRPELPRAKPVIRHGLESTIPPAQAEKITLVLKDIRITGNTVFSRHQLQNIWKKYLNKRISLSTIFSIAKEITRKYGKAGYTLSRAIIPPQELSPSGAVVHIRILEGYIDKVVWPQKKLARYRDFFKAYEKAITSERPIRAQTMERYLLLANDLPGLKFSSTLRPSTTNALASTMYIDVGEDRERFQFSLDNRGTTGSGRLQPSAALELYNVMGVHESYRFAYSAAGPERDSLEPELNYIQVQYSQILNSEGLNITLYGNFTHNRPDTAVLRSIDYKGHVQEFGLILSYPLIRTRPQNLSLSGEFRARNSKGYQLGNLSIHDKLRILIGKVTYDLADEGGGINQVTLTLSKGIEGLGSTRNNNPLASRAEGRVDFFKAELHLSRLQNLPANFQLYTAFQGQWTKHSLLSSQECGLGGAQFGRAFDPSIIAGDKCVQFLGELRYNVAPEKIGFVPRSTGSIVDYLQLYGFLDYGKIWNINAPAGTASKDDLASGGLGMRLGKGAFSADLQISRQLDLPNIETEKSWRVFFTLSAQF